MKVRLKWLIYQKVDQTGLLQKLINLSFIFFSSIRTQSHNRKAINNNNNNNNNNNLSVH